MAGQTSKYKTSKIKSFLFFLLLALVFWVLTKFSEESVAIVNGQLSYTNLPASVTVSPNTTRDVNFEMAANGFQFLSYNLNPPTIKIDMSNYYEQGDTVVLISDSEVNNIIASQLDNNSRVSNLSIDELAVNLDLIVSKKVPVKFNGEITYLEGFKSIGPIVLIPDSVLVSGPSGALYGVMVVNTELYVKENVGETLEASVGLLLPEDSKLSVSEETINFKWVVEEFSQKRLTIPVEVVNVPADIKLKLLPETIVLSFDVSVNQFNSISANDFSIVCDYATRSSEENILVPKLVGNPEGLHHLEWSTKKVEYLIFK